MLGYIATSNIYAHCVAVLVNLQLKFTSSLKKTFTFNFLQFTTIFMLQCRKLYIYIERERAIKQSILQLLILFARGGRGDMVLSPHIGNDEHDSE